MAIKWFEGGSRIRHLLVWYGALAALGGLATSAQAQTTTCQWIGNVWTCGHQQAPAQSGINIDWGAFQRGQEQQAAQQQQNLANLHQRRLEQQAQQQRAEQEAYQRSQTEQAQQRQESQTQRQESLKIDVGRLLQAGDCQGAQSRALADGDIVLANQAKEFCAKP